MVIKEALNIDNRLDPAGIPYALLIEADGSTVAGYKKAQFGPGFFLHVFGSKWQNAPGARYPQERDLRTDYTYCKNRTIMFARVSDTLAERLA